MNYILQKIIKIRQDFKKRLINTIRDKIDKIRIYLWNILLVNHKVGVILFTRRRRIRFSDPFPIVATFPNNVFQFPRTSQANWKAMKNTSVPRIPPAVPLFPRNRQENSRTIDSTERIERSIRPGARNTGCFSMHNEFTK